MNAHRNPQATVIARPQHTLSRSAISPNALRVLYRLHQSNYRACLVGGSVRDLLLGREPKDFDIGTDAHPDEVKQLFRNCRLIGRRFRLAHVHFGAETIEVATYRALQNEDADADADNTSSTAVVHDAQGLIIRDNVYGTIEEDALRRDFTVNALYYDIADFSVLDFVDGMADLEAGLIRLIGDPEQRYREDPVRMLRAVRFAIKLGFRLHPDTEAPIHKMGHLLQSVPPARLFDEVLKIFMGGYAVQTFELLRLYGLFGHLLPFTERCLRRPGQGFPRALLIRALNNTDDRIAAGKPVTPAFLFAALLWEPLRERMQSCINSGLSEREAFEQTVDQLIAEQCKHTALPRRFTLPMREIWAMQPRFEQRSGKRPLRFLEHPRFRAAYDFMLLRAASGQAEQELADWWTHIQTLQPPQRAELCLAKTGDEQRQAPRQPRRRPRSVVAE